MLKKLVHLLLVILLFLGLSTSVAADDGPSYSIQSYDGHLQLNPNNTGVFEETVTYHFSSSYNGVYVSLGKAGKMPVYFGIGNQAQVKLQVKKKDSSQFIDVPELTDQTAKAGGTFHYQMQFLADGSQVKVYYPGDSGDTLRVTVVWNLSYPLEVYRDVAVLNWQPLTDWDKKIGQVNFRISGLSNHQMSRLEAHRGLFKQQPQVSKDNQGYLVTLSDLPPKNRLELHGYWSADQLSDKGQAGKIDQDGLPLYESLENDIVKEKSQVESLLRIWIPALFALLLVLAVFSFIVFKSNLRKVNPYPSNARLYEPPQDLAPALVARFFYDAKFHINSDLDPSTISYKKMIEASLLDLIDRGHLEIIKEGSGLILKRGKVEEDLSEFERQLISMAMGASQIKGMEELFDTYRSASVRSMKKRGMSESRIRKAGKALKDKIRSDFKLADDALVREGYSYALRDGYRSGPLEVYRRLTSRESFFINLSFVLLGGAIALSFLAPIYCLWKYATWAVFPWFYIPLFMTAVIMAYFIHKNSQFARYHGVVKEEYQEDYYQWNSFKNMLRDVARLDKAELESIVLWDRILVYASLFGYAKRVTKVMKLHDIDLNNQVLQSINSRDLATSLALSTYNLSQGISGASEASNFNVSSSSGSSGGGFSGGGGGGGGGAF